MGPDPMNLSFRHGKQQSRTDGEIYYSLTWSSERVPWTSSSTR
jgi:hypothetical protein